LRYYDGREATGRMYVCMYVCMYIYMYVLRPVSEAQG
jgi:hypothetical protein